jgi:cellulose synthase operon protein C
LGFENTSINGGLRWNPGLGDQDSRFLLEIERRPVTDSLLSYAGQRDPVTGRAMGAVARTGGQVGLDYDNGRFGLFGRLGYYTLTGSNVVDNETAKAGAGGWLRLVNTDRRSLQVGLDLTAMTYRRNLSGYTLGHGGYFSPQAFYAVNLPVEYRFAGQHYRLAVGGALGIQSVTTNAEDWFPADPVLQQAAVDVAIGNDLPGPRLAAQSSLGLGYRANVSGEYDVSPSFSLGGELGLDNASDYHEQVLRLYLKKRFDP